MPIFMVHKMMIYNSTNEEWMEIVKIKIAVGYDFYVSMKRAMIDWYVTNKMYDFCNMLSQIMHFVA